VLPSAVLPQKPDRPLEFLGEAIGLGFGGGDAEAGAGRAR